MRKNRGKRKVPNGQSTNPRLKGQRDRPSSTTSAGGKSSHGELHAKWPTVAARRLARALTAGRVKRDISRREVADFIGVNPVTIWRWEQQVVTPRRPSLLAWADGMSKLIARAS